MPRVDPTAAIRGFIAKFDPKVARQIRACRGAVRKLMPTAIELVYDNYNFLVFGFCSTERASDCIVSLACSARGVSLCFIYGARLPDPDGILQGGGNQTRFVRLDGPATLKGRAVAKAVRAAIAYGSTPLPVGRKGYTVVKSVSAKQRPRRDAKLDLPKRRT
ncbi:MAG TPA: hypothetical protein VE046_06180 [Steroidobacteraceae bacterium]|nr:hypothetical protein [Steroidobacteraceae bacterium]